eukprot:Blabericola_migrator_1__12443@NODE_784_length_6546_cov_108_280599_g555_i0_p6_GENE_NODE_784_length_6546_cov_108_280599_g555_i0NODE_784_length_6546_cov_108_280599_g555_i0_p6_ORF_typecomplete_len273_score49_32_NODE_784_length_6546_cov_108_280599_g555_i02821100
MLLGHYLGYSNSQVKPWLRSVYLYEMFQHGLQLLEWLTCDTRWEATQLIMSLVANAFAANRLIERVVTRLLSKKASSIRRAADDVGGQRGVLEGYLEESCPIETCFGLRRVCGSLSLAGTHHQKRPQIVLVTTPVIGSNSAGFVLGFRDRSQRLVTNQLGFMIAKFAKSICGITKMKQDHADSTLMELPGAEARKLFTQLFPKRRRPTIQRQKKVGDENVPPPETVSDVIEDLLYTTNKKRPSPQASDEEQSLNGHQRGAPAKKKRLDLETV